VSAESGDTIGRYSIQQNPNLYDTWRASFLTFALMRQTGWTTLRHDQACSNDRGGDCQMGNSAGRLGLTGNWIDSSTNMANRSTTTSPMTGRAGCAAERPVGGEVPTPSLSKPDLIARRALIYQEIHWQGARFSPNPTRLPGDSVNRDYQAAIRRNRGFDKKGMKSCPNPYFSDYQLSSKCTPRHLQNDLTIKPKAVLLFVTVLIPYTL